MRAVEETIRKQFRSVQKLAPMRATQGTENLMTRRLETKKGHLDPERRDDKDSVGPPWLVYLGEKHGLCLGRLSRTVCNLHIV